MNMLSQKVQVVWKKTELLYLCRKMFHVKYETECLSCMSEKDKWLAEVE